MPRNGQKVHNSCDTYPHHSFHYILWYAQVVVVRLVDHKWVMSKSMYHLNCCKIWTEKKDIYLTWRLDINPKFIFEKPNLDSLLVLAIITGFLVGEILKPLFWSIWMNSIKTSYKTLFTSCNYACNGVVSSTQTSLFKQLVESVPGLNPVL